MKNVDEIMEDFMEDYREDPEGWSFWTKKSDDFYDIYVINDDRGYFIKVDSIYTQNTLGMGKKIQVEKDQLKQKLPDFGFRKFKKDELKSFLESLSSQDQKKKQEVVEKKMKKKPTLPKRTDDDEYLMLGPFNRGEPFRYPLEEHEKVNRELRKKLKEKFRKKYPMYR